MPSAAQRFLKPIAQAVLREDYPRVQRHVEEFQHRRWWRSTPLAAPTRAVAEHHGLVVQGGPFSGLRYPPDSIELSETVAPKILGIYEQELNALVETLVAADHDVMVNIGSAEGYYAIGLAMRSPGMKVIAFDRSATQQRLCREMAARNGVAERIEVRGECGLDELREITAERPLVVADCEGCEVDLLCPEQVSLLRRAAVVVELHDFLRSGATEQLDERFAATHGRTLIGAEPRYPSDSPALAEVGLGFIDEHLAVTEFRPEPMSWVVYEPRD